MASYLQQRMLAEQKEKEREEQIAEIESQQQRQMLYDTGQMFAGKLLDWRKENVREGEVGAARMLQMDTGEFKAGTSVYDRGKKNWLTGKQELIPRQDLMADLYKGGATVEDKQAAFNRAYGGLEGPKLYDTYAASQLTDKTKTVSDANVVKIKDAETDVKTTDVTDVVKNLADERADQEIVDFDAEGTISADMNTFEDKQATVYKTEGPGSSFTENQKSVNTHLDAIKNKINKENPSFVKPGEGGHLTQILTNQLMNQPTLDFSNDQTTGGETLDGAFNAKNDRDDDLADPYAESNAKIQELKNAQASEIDTSTSPTNVRNVDKVVTDPVSEVVKSMSDNVDEDRKIKADTDPDIQQTYQRDVDKTVPDVIPDEIIKKSGGMENIMEPATVKAEYKPKTQIREPRKTDYLKDIKKIEPSKHKIPDVTAGKVDLDTGSLFDNVSKKFSEVSGTIGDLQSVHSVLKGDAKPIDIAKLTAKVGQKFGSEAVKKSVNKFVPGLNIIEGLSTISSGDSTDLQKAGGAMTALGGIAATNFWNPAGWVAGALSVGGALASIFGGGGGEEPENVPELVTSGRQYSKDAVRHKIKGRKTPRRGPKRS